MANRLLKVAAIQMAMTAEIAENLKVVTQLIEKAASEGAKLIVIPELFLGKYFCQIENYDHFEFAIAYNDDVYFPHFQALAKRLGVIIPFSYFEKAGNVFYNSIAVFDTDGTLLGQYRKTHIPTGESYQEKFYFTPGDTGYQVFKTKLVDLGIGICWDQWFPEVARCLVLDGAELLMYPTAIGSEPTLPVDSQKHWQTTMQGHAAANIVPLIASNRIGKETYGNHEMTFYGSSFMTDHTGQILAQLSRDQEGIIYHTYDLDVSNKARRHWGVFRDRRPSTYTRILHK
jgi:N-carbamoylputrescine amidase